MLFDATTANDMQRQISAAKSISRQNTSTSQNFAREQMRFQEQSNAKAMQFSAEQSEINRQFQRDMSSTAHQREVQDLIKAGLNPVLSAMNGNGASTPSGSSAQGVSSQGSKGDVDSSANSIVSTLLNAVIGQATALQTTSMNNMAMLQSSAMGANAMMGTANINAKSNQFMQGLQQQFEERMKKDFPQTIPGVWSSLFNGIFKPDLQGENAKQYERNMEKWNQVGDWFKGLLLRDKEYTKKHQ